MPTLADIYSAADSFKRRLYDTASNPLTSAQQMLGYAVDRARAWNERSAQAANESMQTGEFITPETRQMAKELAEGYNPVGMTVWHGSPHLFERFDLKKIGSGEGNQSYGRGLYMAESPGVAKSYKDALSKTLNASENVDPLLQRIGQMALTFGDNTVPGALKWLSKYEEKGAGHTAPAMTSELVKQAKQNFESGVFTPGGALYKVDLPDTHVRRMLDWDSPLKDQPYPVRNLAKKLGMDMKDLGGDLIGKIGKGEEGRKILQEAGIPGIKYYDQMSRGDQTGTRNFVVFDPNHLTILERNNQPIK